MVGRLHGLARVGRQFAAIALTFALLLQGVALAAATVALWQMPPSIEARLPSNCASTAAPPTTIPWRPVALLKVPTLTASSAWPASVTQSKIHSQAWHSASSQSRLRRGFSRCGYCRRSQLTPAHDDLAARRPRHNSAVSYRFQLPSSFA
jgi:hypothetical protein